MNNESELEAVWWRKKGQREEKVRAKSEEQEYLEETLTGHSRTATV